MQANRTFYKEDDSLIKRLTNNEDSIWRENMLTIGTKYNIEEGTIREDKEYLKEVTKTSMKRHQRNAMQTEATQKSKTQHWLQYGSPETQQGEI